jgi:hypothetical protein
LWLSVSKPLLRSSRREKPCKPLLLPFHEPVDAWLAEVG